MLHYLTNDGEVKEIKSGKTIAADCKAFSEHRYGRVIGVLKMTAFLRWVTHTSAKKNIIKRDLYMES